MQVQPYLFFDGRCDEAVEFYKGKLGAEVEMLMRFKDSPEPPPPAEVRPCSRCAQTANAATRICRPMRTTR